VREEGGGGKVSGGSEKKSKTDKALSSFHLSIDSSLFSSSLFVRIESCLSFCSSVSFFEADLISHYLLTA
jgi:hypothetical protein